MRCGIILPCGEYFRTFHHIAVITVRQYFVSKNIPYRHGFCIHSMAMMQGMLRRLIFEEVKSAINNSRSGVLQNIVELKSHTVILGPVNAGGTSAQRQSLFLQSQLWRANTPTIRQSAYPIASSNPL
jgi:hypothetical protein